MNRYATIEDTQAAFERGEIDNNELNDAIAELRGDELPNIQCNNRELRDIGNDAIEALREKGGIYTRSGKLCRILEDENGNAIIDELNCDSIRSMLAFAASWNNIKVNRHGDVITTAITPPLEVAKHIQNVDCKCKPLRGVIEYPILRDDGSIISDGGYDSQSGLFYKPRKGFKLPPVSTSANQADAKAALAKVRDMFTDFPFADDASKDNILAIPLSLIAREMFDTQPMPVIDAPQQATGKSLLASIAIQIVTGHPPAMGAAPEDGEEWRKRISSQLLNGKSVIVFDNLVKTLEDASLALALTSQEWEDRALGSNKMINVPNRALFVATGNNVRVGGDLVTRCYPIRLDAKTSKPQERSEFKHPDIENYVMKNRGELVAAILTMCRAWIVAGKPEPRTIPKMRQTQWRKVVGGILEFAGATAFLSNLREFHANSDDETPMWENFIIEMSKTFKNDAATAGMIFERCLASDELAQCVPPHLAEFLNEKTKAKFAQKLGYAIKARNSKRHGDSGAMITTTKYAASTLYKFAV